QLTILTKILAEKLNERERQIITQKQKEVCELETQLLALGCQEQKIQEIYQKVSENSYQAQIQISPQNN
ncbi:13996_t:CDS:1, partial [Racocetra persica]